MHNGPNLDAYARVEKIGRIKNFQR